MCLVVYSTGQWAVGRWQVRQQQCYPIQFCILLRYQFIWGCILTHIHRFVYVALIFFHIDVMFACIHSGSKKGGEPATIFKEKGCSQPSAVPRKNFLCCGMLRHAAACCGTLRHAAACCGMLLPAHVGTYTSMGADRQGRKADVVPNTFPIHQKSEDLCNNREELTGKTLPFPRIEPRTLDVELGM